MLIQTPGSFLWSASLAVRLGPGGWSTWGIFLVTGCLQGCLLVMGICFEVKARRAANESVGTLTLRGSSTDNLQGMRGDGYLDRSHAETDDEGGANVENVASERSPLINKKKGKKLARTSSMPS